MKYYATIDNQTFEIEINQQGELYIDGQCEEVDFQSIGGSSIYSLLLGNASYEALAEMRNDCYAPPGGEIAIRAPMPGSIIAVPVDVGQSIDEGDVLVVLESMKMENELKAPRAGVVSQVRVQSGESVNQHQTLVAIT